MTSFLTAAVHKKSRDSGNAPTELSHSFCPPLPPPPSRLLFCLPQPRCAAWATTSSSPTTTSLSECGAWKGDESASCCGAVQREGRVWGGCVGRQDLGGCAMGRQFLGGPARWEDRVMNHNI